jgi:translation initiation factor IF-3
MGKKDRNTKDKSRVNQEIKARRVIVISETGDKLGEFMIKDAISLAKDKDLDLVEVSSGEKPICKIMDYGKMLYNKSKADRKKKQTQTQTKTKELNLRPKTDIHDLNVVENKARKFLGQGHRVKIAMEFKGREHAHHDVGAEKCRKMAESLQDIAVVEEAPKMNGRKMYMVLSKRKDDATDKNQKKSQ